MGRNTILRVFDIYVAPRIVQPILIDATASGIDIFYRSLKLISSNHFPKVFVGFAHAKFTYEERQVGNYGRKLPISRH